MLGVSFDELPAIRSWLDRLEQRPAIAREVDVVASL
jgi:glutathione S-transferase